MIRSEGAPYVSSIVVLQAPRQPAGWQGEIRLC